MPGGIRRAIRKAYDRCNLASQAARCSGHFVYKLSSRMAGLSMERRATQHVLARSGVAAVHFVPKLSGQLVFLRGDGFVELLLQGTADTEMLPKRFAELD